MLLIVPGDNESNTEGTDRAGLGVLLEKCGNILARVVRVVAVLEFGVVGLHVFAHLEEDGVEVGTDSGVGHAHVVAKLRDFVDRILIDERGGEFLLSCDHNTIFGLDSDRSLSIAHCSQCMAHLSKISRLVEGRKAIVRHFNQI